LFEAGVYPDKGVTVTADHLAALASTFGDPVPLLIEHSDSPLNMGYLTEVRSEGNELFGTVSLTPEANAMVESSGAKSLSLGLSPDLAAIREVSLVRNPRVDSARLFHGEVRFMGGLEPDPACQAEWRRLREARVGQEVEDLMRAGRLCPAQASFAKALLMSDDTIEFDGESQPIRHLVAAFLERQPRLPLFSERAPAPTSDHSPHLLLPEEAAFYRRHFPDISLDEIAKRRMA
jgi:hypothetical protein